MYRSHSNLGGSSIYASSRGGFRECGPRGCQGSGFGAGQRCGPGGCRVGGQGVDLGSSQGCGRGGCQVRSLVVDPGNSQGCGPGGCQRGGSFSCGRYGVCYPGQDCISCNDDYCCSSISSEIDDAAFSYAVGDIGVQGTASSVKGGGTQYSGSTSYVSSGRGQNLGFVDSSSTSSGGYCGGVNCRVGETCAVCVSGQCCVSNIPVNFVETSPPPTSNEYLPPKQLKQLKTLSQYHF